MQEMMLARAKALLQSGDVQRVLGWQTGEFVYDVTPAAFETAEELDAKFVYNDFCGSNLSKYLVKESRKEGRVLVFLKPCDTYSFNQLIKEHRIARENIYVIGVPCAGKTDGETLKGFGGENMLKLFDAPEWKTLSQSCLGCGACTFVCPTCQCYDIRDFDTGHGIKRFRCWDSCMYSDFTKMASGNPRLTQLERFRQRFMHKLVYFPMNNGGEYGCVGCGRCLAKCPISMNIVKVAKALAEEVK